MELAGLPGWSVRGCTLRDVTAILSVTRASDIASVGEPDWTVEEVVATLTAAHLDPARDSWLAHGPDGTALAWAYVDNPERGPRDNVEVYAVPSAGAPAYGPLLDIALARVAERGPVTLRAGAVAGETAYTDALTSRGFVLRKRHARMTKVLTGEERPPDARFGIRVVARGELPRYHEVLQTAFADTADFVATSYEDWREGLWSDPGECLVSEVSGRIAGVLQSSQQAVERGEGWIKNLAVLRAHRRAGIGSALLRAAFAVYAAKGRTTAGLGVDLTNPTGAYHLYTSVGMTVAFAADMYERPV